MPLRNLTILVAFATFSLMCYERAAKNRYAGTVTQAMNTIRNEFVEPVDSRQLFEGAMKGMVQNLDPYSDYIPPEGFLQLREDLDQHFGGVGIIVEIDPKTERMIILSPLIETPAYNAGLQAGDVILEIDGKSTQGFTLKDSVAMMRGEPGSTVTLKVRPFGTKETRVVALERAIIPVASVLGDRRHRDGTWEFTLEDYPNIGYVRLVSFGESSAEELRKVLMSLRNKIKGLILDVRGNPGGLLTSSVEICDMLIGDGRIVSTHGRGGVVQEIHTGRKGNEVLPQEFPIVVLVDHYSASAAEILAACLQDSQRATVIGQRTWGKGTVQNVIELEGGRSALKLTTATYWRPSGKNIHRLPSAKEKDDWGVSPTEGFNIPLTDEQYIQVITARRQRDAGRTAEATADADTKSETNQGETSDEKPKQPDKKNDNAPGKASPVSASIYGDPQLQKAVDFLMQPVTPKKAA